MKSSGPGCSEAISANLGLINRSIHFCCIKMVFTFYILCCFRSLKLKVKDKQCKQKTSPKYYNELQAKFSLILGLPQSGLLFTFYCGGINLSTNRVSTDSLALIAVIANDLYLHAAFYLALQ